MIQYIYAELLSELFRPRRSWPPIPNGPKRTEKLFGELYGSLVTSKSSQVFLAFAASTAAYPTIGPQPMPEAISSFHVLRRRSAGLCTPRPPRFKTCV